jgi:hypothetical protein
MKIKILENSTKNIWMHKKVKKMPRLIGEKYHAGATNADRQTMGKGTIPCSICERPASGQAPDRKYYCSYHMRQKYGFIPMEP